MKTQNSFSRQSFRTRIYYGWGALAVAEKTIDADLSQWVIDRACQ